MRNYILVLKSESVQGEVKYEEVHKSTDMGDLEDLWLTNYYDQEALILLEMKHFEKIDVEVEEDEGGPFSDVYWE